MYLRLEGLTKTYGGPAAVDRLDLDVERGEMLSILGPSGCGKTTTINMVGGFVGPTAGRILLDGEEITGLTPNVRPTATVFQSYALFPHLSVMGNVVYGLRFRKVPRAEARRRGEEFLDMVGLSAHRDARVSQLSGGEQQRVALARALILRPKVLLLDEPLSNLDAKLRIGLRREIKDLQERLGITALYVTHDQEEALSLSDRVAVMRHGRIEQVGRPEDLYRRPDTAFVAGFLGRANMLRHGRDRVMVRPEDMAFSHGPGRCRGVVARRQFSGPVTTYFIVLDDGDEVEMDVLSNEDRGRAPGDEVRLDWRRSIPVRG